MRIVYDDLAEFAEIRLRCENTRKSRCVSIAHFMTGALPMTTSAFMSCAAKLRKAVNLMRERLIELVGQATAICDGTFCWDCEYKNEIQNGRCCSSLIADRLLANGVIVPPYRCGTVVYVVRSQTSNGKNLYMRKERIDHYRTFNNGTFMIFESGRISVRDDQWGRCVFATPEEAEQALKGECND